MDEPKESSTEEEPRSLSSRAADVTTEQGATSAREDAIEIPVLSLWQPWATLIALGVKTIETRGWPTAYRGPLAIHAAKRKPPLVTFVGDYHVAQGATWLHGQGHDAPMPFGAIVAVATLIEVLPIVGEDDCCWEQCRHPNAHPAIDGQVIWHHDGRHHTTVVVEQAYGDYTPGRWAWVLADVEALTEPVPFKGGQALSRRVALDELVPA